jgi:hypothetical protein
VTDRSGSVPSTPPPASLVRDADKVVTLFGQFDLHDAELRAVRLAVDEGNVPLLELDLDLPGAAALPGGAAVRGTDYRVVLRCVDVSGLSLADFGSENVVSAYAITPDGVDEDGRPMLHVMLTCAPGCDLDFRCREIAVARVTRVG